MCDIAKQPDSLGNMELFLGLLNAIVCYSSLPVDALVPFVTTLCHTLNVERFCENSWQVHIDRQYFDCSIRVFCYGISDDYFSV